MDFIFTVCDDAADEVCPIWPGHPVTAHWGLKDSAKAEGDGQHAAFARTLRHLSNRIVLFMALPLESIGETALQNRLRSIGWEEGAT